MHLISYQSKTGLVMGRTVRSGMTDVNLFNLALAYSKNMNLPENTFIFNMFVYVQHLVLNCWSLK